MTATELLIEAMSKFSTAEPDGCVVVWMDEEETVSFMANCGNVGTIGMMEYAKHSCLNALKLSEEDHGR